MKIQSRMIIENLLNKYHDLKSLNQELSREKQLKIRVQRQKQVLKVEHEIEAHNERLKQAKENPRGIKLLYELPEEAYHSSPKKTVLDQLQACLSAAAEYDNQHNAGYASLKNHWYSIGMWLLYNALPSWLGGRSAQSQQRSDYWTIVISDQLKNINFTNRQKQKLTYEKVINQTKENLETALKAVPYIRNPFFITLHFTNVFSALIKTINQLIIKNKNTCQLKASGSDTQSKSETSTSHSESYEATAECFNLFLSNDHTSQIESEASASDISGLSVGEETPPYTLQAHHDDIAYLPLPKERYEVEPLSQNQPCETETPRLNTYDQIVAFFHIQTLPEPAMLSDTDTVNMMM